MAQIPDEIWLEVINNLDRSSLRCVRLVNKNHCALATRRLFRVLTIRPNSSSMRRALNIAERKWLAAAVKELHLRAETIPNHAGEIARAMEDHRFEFWDEPELGRVDFGKYFFNFPDLEHAEFRYGRTADESEDLEYLCAKLSGLRHVERWSHYGHYWTPDSMFAGTYGVPVTRDRRGFLPRNVLEATSSSNANHVTSIRFDAVEWHELKFAVGRWQPNAGKHLHSHIRKLDIAITLTASSLELTEEDLGALGEFLDSFDTLVDLKLDLHMNAEARRPLGHHPDEVSMWQKVLERRWRSLGSLEINNVSTVELHLLAFLAGHRKTLKKLKVTNLIMHNGAIAPKAEQNLVMRFIWTLPHILQLDHFDVSGYLIACGWEKWLVSDVAEHKADGSMKHRLCDYVCGKADYPFPRLVNWFMRDYLTRLEQPPTGVAHEQAGTTGWAAHQQEASEKTGASEGGSARDAAEESEPNDASWRWLYAHAFCGEDGPFGSDEDLWFGVGGEHGDGWDDGEDISELDGEDVADSEGDTE